MLTDEWYPTLTKPNVELVTDRIADIKISKAYRGDRRPSDHVPVTAVMEV